MAEATPSKMVFVCIDPSEHSMRAFDWYFNSLHKEGDKVGLIHVHVPPELPTLGLYGGGMGAMELFKEELQVTIDASKALVQKYKDICVSKGVAFEVFIQTVEDSIGHTICKIAKSNHATLIVAGQRGLGAVRRTLFGSVSDYVLHHAHIPVAIVPPALKST